MGHFEKFYKTYNIKKTKPCWFCGHSVSCEKCKRPKEYPPITLEMEQKLEEIVMDIIGGIGWQKSYSTLITSTNNKFGLEQQYTWECFGTYEDDENWAWGKSKEEALVKLLTKLYPEYKDDKFEDIYGDVRKVFGLDGR